MCVQIIVTSVFMANKPVHKQTTKPTPFESKHDAATMLLSCYVNEF